MQKFTLVTNFTEDLMDEFLKKKFQTQFPTEAKFISKGFREQVVDWIKSQRSDVKLTVKDDLDNDKVSTILRKCQGELWCEKLELKKDELFKKKGTPLFKTTQSRLSDFIDNCKLITENERMSPTMR
jgi:hypothetical protein